MKKLATFAIAVLLLLMTNVNAASNCGYQEQAELNSKAANIKVSYEVVKDVVHFADGDAETEIFEITILNLTEDFYIVVSEEESKDVTYRSSDSVNGEIKFKWDDLSKVNNFTFKVYTSSVTKCPNEKMKTLYLTTPRYNEYYGTTICNDNPDVYLCEKFVTFSKIERDDFYNEIEKYEAGTIDDDGEEIEPPVEKTFMDKFFDFINLYKWYIISGGLIIIITITVIYRVKTKKQRELGL